MITLLFIVALVLLVVAVFTDRVTPIEAIVVALLLTLLFVALGSVTQYS